jgi:hypothetical protein
MFLDKSKNSYIGNIITMLDKYLYKAWDKLAESLKTNKLVNAAEVGGAESISDRAKCKQAVKEILSSPMQSPE